jgi:phage baseplate assembly protein W
MTKNSINIKIPLVYSSEGPYETNKNIIDAINQNIFILFMTNPGERIMNYDYGIGINRFLFENINYEVIEGIREQIYSQFDKYIIGVNIEQLEVRESEKFSHAIEIKLRWNISSYGISEVFEYIFRE